MNILDITQTIVQGYFNMMMIVDVTQIEKSFPDFITFFNFSYKPALQVSVAAFFSLIWVTHGNFVSSCYVCA